MLDDYLKVRGVGDLVAAGSALVLITMIVHYWGYVLLTGVDLLSYFTLQDYIRLSITFIPIYAVLFVFNLVFYYISVPGKEGKIEAVLRIAVFMFFFGLIVLSTAASVILIDINSSFNTVFETLVSIIILLIGLLIVYWISRIILGADMMGIVVGLFATWLILALAGGVAVSGLNLYASTPSVAVHVNYNDEPIEGTILINLSNTLLLSEPGSTGYIAISQREIRSIERLSD